MPQRGSVLGSGSTPRLVEWSGAAQQEAVRPFDFHTPTSLNETFELLERYGEEAHLIAAGPCWCC